jgi:hypothetical protein
MRYATLRHLSVSLALMLVACGASSSDSNVSPVLTPVGEVRALQDGWFEAHPEPNLVLKLRKGWSANRGEGGVGPINILGPDGARVVVWPMFVDKSMRMPAQYSILTGFARIAAPEFSWSQPAQFGGNGERMYGRSQGAVAQATFTYTNTSAGLAGFWYLTAARQDQYESLRPLFADLMRGVRIFGSAGSGGAPRNAVNAPRPAPVSLRFVAWTEPNEGAYTTEVPQGWKVTGGLVRPDPLRLLDPVDMQSPDGLVYAFSGDRTLPMFKTPTRGEQSLGMREGMNNGNGILMRYQPAAEFLRQYLPNRFGQQCPGFQIVDIRDQPELSGEVNRQLAGNPESANQRVDVAVAQIRCSANAVGLVQLVTYAVSMDPAMVGGEGFAIWQVSSVAGFIAPQARAAEAGQAIVRLLTARKVNPQWAQGNQTMVAIINNISQQSSQQISQMINDRFRISNTPTPGSGSSSSSSSIGSSDDLIRQRENAMMDQTDVIDQRTGESYKVVSGSNYYWVNPQGTIAGTNAPSQPTTDFQEMTQLP